LVGGSIPTLVTAVAIGPMALNLPIKFFLIAWCFYLACCFTIITYSLWSPSPRRYHGRWLWRRIPRIREGQAVDYRRMISRAIFNRLPSAVRARPALCVSVLRRANRRDAVFVCLATIMGPYIRWRPLLWLAIMFSSSITLARQINPIIYWPLIVFCIEGYRSLAAREPWTRNREK
jgi:hypothetical protein